MQFLSIGVSEQDNEIKERLCEELEQLKNKQIDVKINEVETGGASSIICSVEEVREVNSQASLLYDTLRSHVSNVLADYIIKKYEEKLIVRIVNNNYCYFNTSEKKDITRIAIKNIHNEDKNILNSLYTIRRRNLIVRRLLDYFQNSNDIILDGFVNFRLKDYMKDLEDVVEKAVDDFLMEREYKEFIRLLKYFVEIQEPKFNMVHVIAGFDNRYMLLDENKREITNECIQEFVNEVSEGEINYDDLLVSSLITLAPARITIHVVNQFRNKELLETIKNVFSGKVTLCTGCELCTANVSGETRKVTVEPNR